MSTNYYGLRDDKGLTDLSLFEDRNDSNWIYVSLSINHCPAGKLYMSKTDWDNFKWLMFEDEDSILHGYYGGISAGACLRIKQDVTRDTIVISEYGEVCTVEEVLSKYKTIENESLIRRK